MVLVNNVTIAINERVIVADLSCILESGEITSFIGSSGAGKTTLLTSIVGLTPIKKGSIIINGAALADVTLTQRSEQIGYVFQDFNLFGHMTVLENCIDPQVVHGMPEAEAIKIAIATLASVAMDTFVDRYPSQLSGGQKQRVAIARALCLQPKILLLDEPTASLDPVNTDALVTILQHLAGQGLTIGLSSQDMSFVSKVFDKIYFLQDGSIAEMCDGKGDLIKCPLIEQFLK